MQRLIQDTLRRALADELLFGKLVDGGSVLVDIDADGKVVGHHYAFAGPTRPAWESESGSRVVGARSVPGVTVTPGAIPWLILSAVPDVTIGPGIFARTTYIQRVNTTGGLAPVAAPTPHSAECRAAHIGALAVQPARRARQARRIRP